MGDPTTGGGKVIEGSSGSTIMGKPIARVGDKATCTIKGHGGVVTILEGSASDIIDGKPTAFDKCSLSCGCKVMATQGLYLVEAGGGGGASGKKSAEKKIVSSATKAAQTGDFNEHFVVFDKSTGKPFPGFKYVIEHRGELIEGELCELGKTDLIYSDKPEPVILKYLIQTQIGVRE